MVAVAVAAEEAEVAYSICWASRLDATTVQTVVAERTPEPVESGMAVEIHLLAMLAVARIAVGTVAAAGPYPRTAAVVVDSDSQAFLSAQHASSSCDT